MTKWKATMSRQKLETGTVQFVLGLKFSNGERIELDGVAHNSTIKPLVDKLMADLKLDKVEPV